VVEEIISSEISTASACRKYSIAYPLLQRWKKDYAMGRLENEPTTPAGYEERIARLERMIGKLTMENEVLKKALQRVSSQSRRNGQSSPVIFPPLEASGRGAKC
jgi:transposase-like protein